MTAAEAEVGLGLALRTMAWLTGVSVAEATVTPDFSM